MRHIKMSEIISRSVDRSVNILFKPFQLKKWLILVFIALFAGALPFGSAGNGGGGSPSRENQKQVGSQAAQPQTSGAVSEKTPQAKPGTGGSESGLPVKTGKKFWIAIAVVIGLVAASFALVIFWLSANFDFIWFSAIASNDASIIGPFHKHRSQGRSLFKASLVYVAIFFTAIALIILWGVLAAMKAGAFQPGFAWSLPIALHLFWMPLTCALLVIVAAIITSVAIAHFTVMIMALDKTTFLKAFGKTIRFHKDNPGDVTLFYVLFLLLWLVCSVMALIVVVVVFVVFLLVGALLIGIGYLLFMALMKMKLIFAVYCVIIGIPWFVALLAALLCAELPFAVFFRSFSIEYLCSFEGGYTYETLDRYAQERSSGRSKAIVVLPIIFMALISFILIVGLLAAIAIPNFIMARDKANAALADKCITNMKAIETVKNMWAKDAGPAQGRAPAWEELVPAYLVNRPVCPKGGVYTIGSMVEEVRCSIGDNKTQRADDDHLIK